MGRRPMVYGLDIETDCTENGTDPKVATVRTVALSSESCDEVFSGEEADLLEELDERLASLPPGVLATWNGAAFDLPFLADRAFVCGVPIGLRLRHDGRLGMRRAPLPGHPGAYRGSWYGHRHLDAYRVYRGDASASPRLPLGLRCLARLCGTRVVDVERDFAGELEREVRHAYAAGDARLARVLTERRWPGARAYVDRRVADHGPWVPPWFEEVEVATLEVHAFAGVAARTGYDPRPHVEVELRGARRVGTGGDGPVVADDAEVGAVVVVPGERALEDRPAASGELVAENEVAAAGDGGAEPVPVGEDVGAGGTAAPAPVAGAIAAEGTAAPAPGAGAIAADGTGAPLPVPETVAADDTRAPAPVPGTVAAEGTAAPVPVAGTVAGEDTGGPVRADHEPPARETGEAGERIAVPVALPPVVPPRPTLFDQEAEELPDADVDVEVA